jgi:hypothetical protein
VAIGSSFVGMSLFWHDVLTSVDASVIVDVSRVVDGRVWDGGC